MKTLAKLSDKRDQIVYQENIYKHISHFIFPPRHLERMEWGLGRTQTFFLPVERPF
jgi:hypothetical protein